MKGILSRVPFIYDVRTAETEPNNLFGRGKAEFRGNYSPAHDANELAGLNQKFLSNWADA